MNGPEPRVPIPAARHSDRGRDDWASIILNIIAEKVLGLPGEHRTDKDVPFKDMPTWNDIDLLPTDIDEDLRTNVRALLAARASASDVSRVYDDPGFDVPAVDAGLFDELELAWTRCTSPGGRR